jgi:hypothetical protein
MPPRLNDTFSAQFGILELRRRPSARLYLDVVRLTSHSTVVVDAGSLLLVCRLLALATKLLWFYPDVYDSSAYNRSV